LGSSMSAPPPRLFLEKVEWEVAVARARKYKEGLPLCEMIPFWWGHE